MRVFKNQPHVETDQTDLSWRAPMAVWEAAWSSGLKGNNSWGLILADTEPLRGLGQAP